MLYYLFNFHYPFNYIKGFVKGVDHLIGEHPGAGLDLLPWIDNPRNGVLPRRNRVNRDPPLLGNIPARRPRRGTTPLVKARETPGKPPSLGVLAGLILKSVITLARDPDLCHPRDPPDVVRSLPANQGSLVNVRRRGIHLDPPVGTLKSLQLYYLQYIFSKISHIPLIISYYLSLMLS